VCAVSVFQNANGNQGDGNAKLRQGDLYRAYARIPCLSLTSLENEDSSSS